MNKNRAPAALAFALTLLLAACPDDPEIARLVATDDEAVTYEDREVVVPVLANDVDEAGGPLAVVEVDAPQHGRAFERAGKVVYRPARDWAGTDAFAYTVRSQGGAEKRAKVTVTVNPVNDPPVPQHDATTLLEDGSARIEVLANDTDPEGDALSIQSHGQGLGGTVTQDGDALVYDADADFDGQDAFTYLVTDGHGGVAMATVSVSVDGVNDAPRAAADAATVDEDGAVRIDVLANDRDPDRDAITLMGFEQGAHGAVTAEAGALRYAPEADFHGADTFTYRIADPSGERATGRVTVTVRPVNDAPVAVDDAAELDEGGSTLVHVLANDLDVDGDVLTIIAFEQGSAGAVTLEDGRLRYTATGDFAGADSFGYTVEDAAGASASAVVRVTVNQVNDAPAANADVASVDEDGSVLVDVLANDTDVEGDALTVVAFGQGAHGTVSEEPGGLRYTPEANWHGADSFTYEIADGNGGTATGQVEVTVSPVDDALAPADDAVSVDEDATVLVDVLGNDVNVDGTGLSLSTFTQGAHGAVTREGDALRYAPAPDFHGADTFTYEVTDTTGEVASATVDVTVVPVNDAPAAADDTAELDEDGAALVAVLANDSDRDGDLLVVTGFTQGAHGAVTQEGDSLRYTADADFHGADAFTYEVSDGNGGLASATVSVTVNAVNDVPAANDDAAAVDEDGTVLVDVLVNDTDADGDTLSITGFGQGAHGVVAQEGDSLRYTPDADFFGSDAFTYDVADGNGGIAAATVTVTVNPVNDLPVANDDSASLDQDGTVLLNVLANDTDPDGDAVSITGFAQGSSGTVSQEGAALRYTPNAGFSGTDTFTYDIGDGVGGIATATVTVEVLSTSLLSMDIVEPSGQTGFIQFEVTTAGTYEIRTSYYQQATDTVVYLYDAAQTQIAVNDDYTDLYGTLIQTLDVGTYYVRVEDFGLATLYCHLEVTQL